PCPAATSTSCSSPHRRRTGPRSRRSARASACRSRASAGFATAPASWCTTPAAAPARAFLAAMSTSAEAAPAPPRRPSAAFMRGRVSRLVALGFGSGLAPLMPGTIGTLWAWLAFAVLDRWLGDAHWALVIAVGAAYGVHACGRVAAELGTDRSEGRRGGEEGRSRRF